MDMDMVSVRKTNFTFNQSALEHMVGRKLIQSIFELSGSWAFLSACGRLYCFCCTFGIASIVTLLVTILKNIFTSSFAVFPPSL